jgi:hypothetical protein
MVRAPGSCEPQPTWQQLNGPGQCDSARELLQPVFEQFVEEAVPGGHFPEPPLS